MTEQRDTKVLVEELRKLAEQATPGPWENHHRQEAACTIENFCHVTYSEHCPALAYVAVTSDAAYIAAASPDRILALIEENQRLREERDRFEGQLAGSRRAHDDTALELGNRTSRFEAERDALLGRVRELEEALEPFAQAAEIVSQRWDGEKHVPVERADGDRFLVPAAFTWGEVRKARSALSKTQARSSNE